VPSKGKESKSHHTKQKQSEKQNRKSSEEDPLPLSEWVEDGKPSHCSINA